ncbi:acyl-coa-binding domain-containing protein 6 [Holotrichia oblita]|uniref:Acyl-coa-binding domain-containing protein 6 n=3 Tax=Holotrichia oblita TaxID=644536 RepID=A0ACB9TUV0_HOLOL|nr:acyl-coa-binding domain-containing protein 6 [Holotrichia oblita]KAI4470410.1 acyl-coa-binding domain-containing protein 6 [Holotrichia oblita]KAI4470411.1 acyl-coa-binding domain-containing protein 6 [Holotrichia oblita]
MAKSSDSFSDLQEFASDSDTEDSISELFTKAANNLSNLLPMIDNEILISLYGYYKQATAGPCKVSKPSWYDVKGKTKWEAWNKLGDMPQMQAKIAYVNIMKRFDGQFLSTTTTKKEFWVTVSTLQKTNEEVAELERSIVDHVKEGDYKLVSECLKSYDLNKLKSILNELDADGLGLVHWASDRGSEDILQLLINEGADINLLDCDKQTPLHYAASCGHINCVKLLISNGADIDIEDVNGDTPVVVSNDDVIKSLFV